MPTVTRRQVALSHLALINSRGFEGSTENTSSSRGFFGPTGPRTSARSTTHARCPKDETSDRKNLCLRNAVGVQGSQVGLRSVRSLWRRASVRLGQERKHARAALEVRWQLRSLWAVSQHNLSSDVVAVVEAVRHQFRPAYIRIVHGRLPRQSAYASDYRI